MYKHKKILCLIPARAGSVGLPNKNIKQLAGKPLIAWTIGQALASKYLDKIIVSTDSRKIARVAEKYKAEVPFIRPARLATSLARIIDVLLHATSYLKTKGEEYDLIMLLQPTSPLRQACDIDRSIELFFKKRAKAVVSVCLTEHHPWLSNTLTAGLRMEKFSRKLIKDKNRQELPVFYRINGAIYLAYISYLKKRRGFLGKDTYAFIMQQEKSGDIDNKLDFDFAQFLMRKNRR